MEPIPSSIPARLEHASATARVSAQQQGKKRPTRGHRAQGESVEARTARIAAEAQEKEHAIVTAMNKGVKQRDNSLQDARKQVFLAQNPQYRSKTEGMAESLAMEITGVEHREEEKRVAEAAAIVIPAAAGKPQERIEVEKPPAVVKDEGPTEDEIRQEEEEFQKFAKNRTNTKEQDQADKELFEALRKASEFNPPEVKREDIEAAGRALLEEEMLEDELKATVPAAAQPEASAQTKDELDDFHVVEFNEKKYWKTVVLADDQILTEKQLKRYEEAQRPDQKEEKCVIS